MRCFVALGLENGPGAALAPWLESTRALFPELAVTPAGNLHLTLSFLGELADGDIGAAGAAVRAAAHNRRWELRWTAGGVFPSASRPRVLWVGVDSALLLGQTQQALVQALAAAGLRQEERAFRPHLTLARVRRGETSRSRRLEIVAHLETLPDLEPARVVSLVLYQSRLGPGPAVHQPLVVAPLRLAGG